MLTDFKDGEMAYKTLEGLRVVRTKSFIKPTKHGKSTD